MIQMTSSKRHFRRSLFVVVTLVSLTACSDGLEPREGALDTNGDSESDGSDLVVDTSSPDTTNDGSVDGADDGLDTSTSTDNPNCDPLVPTVCALPFPSTRWLEEDDSRTTGYRIAFGPETLPMSSTSKHVDGAPYARMDGFGVGSFAVAHFPQLDPSELPNETEVAASLEPDADIVLFEVGDDGGLTRIPYFAEVDLRTPKLERRALMVRPAVVLKPATRYIIAMRDLPSRDGGLVEPSAAFRQLRDGESEGTAVEDRQAHFDEIFDMLESAGVERGELQIAWDWWTASDDAIHGPMLTMRDEALEAVGESGPPLEIIEIEALQDHPDIAYEVVAEMTVPHYLVRDDIPGADEAWSLNFDRTWTPHRVPDDRKAELRVRIPHSALDGTPHAVVLHGHGLNGTNEQIRQGWFGELANQENFIIAGVNMLGMTDADEDVITGIIVDLSFFPRMIDRLHQGMLEHLLAMRALRSGFDQLPEIADLGLVIDRENLWYNGISQGGIYGGTIMALATDFTRGQLGVPGINYSLLISRSVDFEPFFAVLEFTYRDPVERWMMFSVIQTLWDQVDPVSHMRHISHDPLPNTPAHRVLLGPAVGDYQVSVMSNEILARSELGIPLMQPWGRELDLVDPVDYPHDGSGIVLWDFGNPWAPPGPVTHEDEIGDPHEWPRRTDAHNEQMMHFFRTGEIIDVCDGSSCEFPPRE